MKVLLSIISLVCLGIWIKFPGLIELPLVVLMSIAFLLGAILLFMEAKTKDDFELFMGAIVLLVFMLVPTGLYIVRAQEVKHYYHISMAQAIINTDHQYLNR